MAVVLHGFHKDLYGVLEEVTASAWVYGTVSGFSNFPLDTTFVIHWLPPNLRAWLRSESTSRSA